LAINPLAAPYRAHMPRSLERLGQSFATTVNICVNARGNVAGVSSMGSSEAAVDREVSRAISRWRYRPLLEAGRAIPFCYVLKYELESQR
jgi:TonB family protein